MNTEFIFVEFCALVCVVTLSFRLGRIIRRRMKSDEMAAQTSGREEWYCFFKPSSFRRRRSARPQDRPAVTKSARPRARMSVN